MKGGGANDTSPPTLLKGGGGGPCGPPFPTPRLRPLYKFEQSLEKECKQNKKARGMELGPISTEEGIKTLSL